MAAVRLRNAYQQKRASDELSGDVIDVIRDLDDVIINTYNRLFRYGERHTRLAIKIQGGQQPNRGSRVQPSDKRDALGLPQTRLNRKLSELDRKSVDVLVRAIAADFARLDIARTRLDDWAQEAAGKLFPSDLRGGVHHTGTACMSADARSGVVDKNCRVLLVDNLFMAGSSVFPPNSRANPTLTIRALNLRSTNWRL